MAGEIDNAIRDNATAPASISADGRTVTEHSLPDQIAAAEFLAAQTASPLRVARVLSPSGSRCHPQAIH